MFSAMRLFLTSFLTGIIFAMTACNNESNGVHTPVVCKLGDAGSEAAYVAANPRFAKVFEFIKANGLERLAQFPDGKHMIDGDKIFVNFSSVELKKPQEAKFEVHDKYVDLQLVIVGKERMGVKPRSEVCDVMRNDMAQNDVIFFNDLPDEFVDLESGEYVVFFPSNAHAPAIGEGAVKKCIFKVLAH